MADQSQHVIQIPQAVGIAASQDNSVAPELRQQAIEYLTKVRELSEETWKACLTLYLQGAGATSTNNVGRDGKERLSPDLRVYCLQIVDDVLSNKPQVIAETDLLSLHQALMSYVQTEFVEGSAENGLTFIRNKFCYTLTLCFLRLYPTPVPDFLNPFLAFLKLPLPSGSSPSFEPIIITLRMLCEIAAEVHDPLLRTARNWSAERNYRDGQIRDSVRVRGEVKTIVDVLVDMVEKALESGTQGPPQEVIDLALNVLVTWSPWVDINSSVTADSLRLYQKLVQNPTGRYRNAGLSIYAILLLKGTKTAAEKMQIIQVLDVMSFIEPLEKQTSRTGQENILGEDDIAFRTGLAKVLSAYGTETLRISEDETAAHAVRAEADKLHQATLPFLLKFVETGIDSVSEAVSPLMSDVMKVYKRARRANEAGYVLPPDKVEFFAALLETLVKQMQWPNDAEWNPADPGEEEDEEYEAFTQRRSRLRSDVDQIANIDPELARSRLVVFVLETFNRIQNQGPSAVPWEQVELAVHLIYIYGELRKTSTQGREIFFVIPVELTNSLREKAKDRSEREHVDFNQLEMTPQGQMLEQAIAAGILTYPHSAVTLQYLECVQRYSEFFKCKTQHIQPVLEAFVDQRGIHNDIKAVRQRVIYLFSKFIKEARRYINEAFVPAILNGISDALPIVAVLPDTDNPSDDVLLKATTGSQPFDTHVYLYESVGALIALVKNSDEQSGLLQAAFGPLVQELAAAVQRIASGSQPDPLQVLQVHHVILAIGALARGLSELRDGPSSLPISFVPAFKQPSEAVLQALEAYKNFRIIRDAARAAVAGIISALSTFGTYLVPPLVIHTVDLLEPQELLEFLSFLGMLAHRLKDDLKPILDELVFILFDRVYALLATDATGTDDDILQRNMKKDYLSFINTIFGDDLQSIFLSDRNKPRLDGFISHLLALATDSSDRGDRTAQKSAVFILTKTIQVWAGIPGHPTAFLTEAALLNKETKKQVKITEASTNGHSTIVVPQLLPGYETVVYERVIPAMFSILLDARFKLKDGQSSLVVYEIANMLRELIASRGAEAVDFLTTQYLPSIGCPPAAIMGLSLSVRSEPVKEFKKYFMDFMRDWKTGLGLPY